MPAATTAAAVPHVGSGLTGLGLGAYLVGCLAVAVVVVAVARLAVQVRRVLVPWRGAPARLVEVTIAAGFVSGVAYVVGALHAFSGWPLFLALVLGAVVAERLVARRPDAAGAGSPPFEDAPPAGRVEWLTAAGALAVVGAQWVSHTAWALGHGMTEGDTLWYHGVFAARFVQTGRLDILPDLGNAAQGFFPANSQMLHAVAFFPFDRDLLSPVVNLLLASIAVLAAYCIGRRRGLGPMCVAACAAVMGIPGIVGTHPGQATNDFLCATFLLLAVAFLVEGDLEPVPLGLAAVAAALSLGTKLTVAVPIAVMTGIVIGVSVHRRRVALVVAWLIPLAVFGAFWFVRNWVRVDNPLPFYDLHLGPLHFPRRSFLEDDASVADHLFEGATWSRVFRPGLRQAFGPAWPLFVAAPFAAAVGMLVRGRRVGERVAGMVAISAAVGYVLMPFTMELGGAAFAATARYAAPALLLGAVVLVPAARVDRWRAPWRAVAAVGWLAVVVVDAAQPDVDRYAPWRIADRPIAIALVVVVVGLVAIARVGGRWARVALLAPVLLAVVLGGFFVQRHYFEHRYTVGAGLRLAATDEYVSAHRPTTVVPFSTIQYYPLFGPAFANPVRVFVPRSMAHSGDAAARCREWERAVRARTPGLVLLAGDAVPVEQPDRRWFLRSPAYTVVLRDGPHVLVRPVGRSFALACPTA